MMTESSWHSRVTIGWKARGKYWVRWTTEGGLYFWLHPVKNRWVGEPEQITMPTFPDAESAMKARDSAPEPPK